MVAEEPYFCFINHFCIFIQFFVKKNQFVTFCRQILHKNKKIVIFIPFFLLFFCQIQLFYVPLLPDKRYKCFICKKKVYFARRNEYEKREQITYIINLNFKSMKKFSFLCFLAMLFCGINAHAAAELTFSNVNLAPGSKIEALTQDQQITFNTNMDAEIGYMLAQIEDETGSVVLSNTTVYDPNFNSTGVSDDKNPKNAPQNKSWHIVM